MSGLRVLHCPATIGGNAPKLAAAERRIGLQSHSVAFRPHPFGYQADETLALAGTSPLRFEARRWKLLARALRDYDVVHFNFGRSILPSVASIPAARAAGHGRAVLTAYRAYARVLELRDLALLRRAGKVVAVTFQGDDARQGDYCRRAFDVNATAETEPDYYTAESDEHARRVIRTFDRYADLVYTLNPDLLHVLPERARFLPYAHVSPEAWKPIGVAREARRPLTVVHAPTHRSVKGTAHVLAAVERLERQRIPFHFLLVEGCSHAEARRRYAQADLLVDQLLLGWYGGLAVEFMALAKPVLAFVREADLRGVPEGMRQELPILRATPDTLYETLRRWLQAPREELAALGERSRRFVEHWHDPLATARRLAADYEEARARRRR